MSVSRPLAYFGFALWVAICAAAPEFIWQGLQALAGHFSLEDLYEIILIGLVLTVFVEPILERARDGRWYPEHRSTRSLLLTAPLAFTLGIVAVGLHKCMTAFLAAGPEPASDGAIRGFMLILEWGSVPLAVTLCWFGARLEGPLRHAAGAGSALWVVGIGWLFGWPLRDTVMTAIPCLVLILAGQAYVARHWGEYTFSNLAVGLGGFIVGWLALTLLLQKLLWPAGVAGMRLFGPGDLGEDVRFYLGWAIGLAIAPHPLPAEDPQPSRLSD